MKEAILNRKQTLSASVYMQEIQKIVENYPLKFFQNVELCF